MIELFRIGISDYTLNEMLELVPEITDMSEEEIKDKINILKGIGCNNTEMCNIIGSNAYYLSRFDSDLNSLIDCLTEYGFSSLNILFDSNPYILNIDKFEIDEFINNRLKKGIVLEEIVDELDSNPNLFNELL